MFRCIPRLANKALRGGNRSKANTRAFPRSFPLPRPGTCLRHGVGLLSPPSRPRLIDAPHAPFCPSRRSWPRLPVCAILGALARSLRSVSLATIYSPASFLLPSRVSADVVSRRPRENAPLPNRNNGGRSVRILSPVALDVAFYPPEPRQPRACAVHCSGQEMPCL